MVLSSSHFISRRTLGTVDEVLLLVKSIYSIVITAVGLFSIRNRVSAKEIEANIGKKSQDQREPEIPHIFAGTFSTYLESAICLLEVA